MTEEELKASLKKIYISEKNFPKIFNDDSIITEKVENYIPQFVTVVEDYTSNKTPIHIEEIFTPLEERNTEIKTILLKGNAGSGKTSIETVLANLWGNEESENTSETELSNIYSIHHFDYVFKVKFKVLLSIRWKDLYTREEQQKFPLACFIYSALDQSCLAPEEKISFEDINTILANKNAKTLLIFDNAEDISHLMNMPGIVKNLIDEAFSLKNKYFILMSVRPNCLTGEQEDMFDRKIEVNGLDERGVELYTKQYFSTQEKSLTENVLSFFEGKEDGHNMDVSLLHYFRHSRNPELKELFIQLKRIPAIESDRSKAGVIKAIDNYYRDIEKLLANLLMNPSVRDLLSSPINASILCLLISDTQVRNKFEEDFREADLYAEVMILIGKRFISKSLENDNENKKKFKDITNLDVFNLNIIKALKEVAYQSLLKARYLNGLEIKEIANKYEIGIRELYEFGVLKTTCNVIPNNLGLTSKSGVDIYNEAPDNLVSKNHRFIHVGFKRYLGVFKIISYLNSSEEREYSEVINLISTHRNDPEYLPLLKFIAVILSEDVELNTLAIDRFWGAILFNINEVLEFGMDRKVTLLMNLLAQNKLGYKILHHQKVLDFIDEFILSDITKHKHLIQETGYLSKRMEDYIWNVLENSNTLEASNNAFSFNRSTKKTVVNIDLESILDISGRFIHILDNKKLLNILLKILNESINSKVSKSSMYLLEKIVKASKVDLSVEIIDNIISLIGKFIEDNSFKILITKVLDYLTYINKDNDESIKYILDSLFNLMKTTENNDVIHLLISNFIKKSGNISLNIALDNIVEIVKNNNYDNYGILSSRSSKEQQLLIDKNEQYKQRTINDIAKLIENIISKFKEDIERDRVFTVVVTKMRELVRLDNSSLNDVSFIVGRMFLVINNRAAQQEISKIIMECLNDSNSQRGIIDVINYDLNGQSLIDSDLLSPIIAKLTELMINPEHLNIGHIIQASSTIINIATKVTEIDFQVRKNTLIALIEIKDGFYPLSYSLIGILASSGDEEMLDKSFEKLVERFEMETIQPIDNVELAMENLTSSEISTVLAVKILARLIPLLKDGDPRVAKSILNIELSEDILIDLIPLLKIKNIMLDDTMNEDNNLSFIQKYIADILIGLLSNKVNFVAYKATLSIEIMINKNPIIKKFIYTKLVGNLKDNHSNIDNTMMLIGKMEDSIDESDYRVRIEEFIALRAERRCDKIIFIKAMANMIKFNPNIRIPQLECFFSGEKKYQKAVSSLSRVVAEVVEIENININADVINDMFAKITSTLPDTKQVKVKSGLVRSHDGVIYAISKLLCKVTNFDLITKNIFKNLIYSLERDRSSYDSVYALNEILSQKVMINHIFDKFNEEYLIKMFNKLKDHLIDKASLSAISKATSSIVSKASTLVGNSVKDTSLDPEVILTKKTIANLVRLFSLNKIILLLEDALPEIYNISIYVLTEKVKELLLNDDLIPNTAHTDINEWHEHTSNMILILKYDVNEEVYGTRRLHDLVHNLLQKYSIFINRDVNYYNDNLDLVIKNFDTLVLKDSSHMFIKLIFHKTLSDGVIAEYETKFISRCISELKLTVSIAIHPAIDGEDIYFTIQFEGIVYKLYGEKNRKYVEEIVYDALQNREDPLSNQYAEDAEPIFPNNIDSIPNAAIDISECPSLLDPNLNLSVETWKVSFIYKTNHHMGEPTDVFIFLETRDLLGNYVGYKLSINEDKTTATLYRSNPEYIDTAFREEVFTKMKYYQVKTRYMVATIEIRPSVDEVRIDLFELNDVIIRSCSDAIRKSYLSVGMSVISSGPEDLYRRMTTQDKQYDATTEMNELHKIFNAHLKLRIKLEENKILGKWDIDKRHFRERDRASLLDLIDARRSDSLSIDTADANSNLNKRAEEFKTHINFNALKKVIKKEELKEHAEKEIIEIEKDTYKAAFYLRLIQIITSVYIASSAIDTEMVENQSSGTVGAMGDILETISPHIPFAGLVVRLMGDVLHAIDDDNEVDKVKRYVTFGKDPEAIRIIAEKIARKLVLIMGNQKFDIENAINVAREDFEDAVDTAGGIVDTGLAVTETITNAATVVRGVVQRGMGGNIVSGLKFLATKLPAAYKRAIKENETPEEKIIREKGQAGEDDAAAIAEFIVKEIFAGKFVKNKWGVSVEEARAVRAVDAVNKKYALIDIVEPKVVTTYSSSSGINIEDVALDIKSKDSSSIEHKEGEEDKSSKCIVMNMRVEGCITQTLEFQMALKLPLKERSEAINNLLNKKSLESFFLRDYEGRAFLNNVEHLYGLENRWNMEEIGKDEDLADQILIASRIQGIEKVLDLFFKVDIEDAVNNIEEKIISLDQNLAISSGFYQYISNALSNNHNYYSKKAKDTLQAINNLSEKIEKWLDKGESGDKVTIALMMIEDLLKVVGSGLKPIPMYRPPHYDPGDDYGPGSGGGNNGNHGDKERSNETEYAVLFLQISSFNGSFIGDYSKGSDSFHEI